MPPPTDASVRCTRVGGISEFIKHLNRGKSVLHCREVSYAVGRLSIYHILQAFVPMHGHRDEVARLTVGGRSDLHSGLATR